MTLRARVWHSWWVTLCQWPSLSLSGPSLMIEADIIMRASDPPEPVMAHPPQTDSDITLREWLALVKEHNKGIKLDFKRWDVACHLCSGMAVTCRSWWLRDGSARSLDAVSPSLALLEEAISMAGRPVWINADILTGPGGHIQPLDPHGFLSAVTTLPTSTVLSLGWTSGWTAGVGNPGEERSAPPPLRLHPVSCSLKC